MGDVGSGYLGFVISVLALAATRNDPSAVWVWLILGGVFFVDATVTLARRTARGDRVYEAHRSHAYQWLARRWGNHLPVTLGVLIAQCAVAAAVRRAVASSTGAVALGRSRGAGAAGTAGRRCRSRQA